MSHFSLNALVKAVDGQPLPAVRQAIKQLESDTQTEPDCLFFKIQELEQSPGYFMLWEIFTDKAALDAHFQMPHTKHYLTKNMTEIVDVTHLRALEANHDA